MWDETDNIVSIEANCKNNFGVAESYFDTATCPQAKR
jgi:hypothetical protein